MGTFISRGLQGYEWNPHQHLWRRMPSTQFWNIVNSIGKKIKVGCKGNRILKSTVIGKNCEPSKNTLCFSKAQIYCLAQLECVVTASGSYSTKMNRYFCGDCANVGMGRVRGGHSAVSVLRDEIINDNQSNPGVLAK